jgi:hypothetical protein
MRKMLIAVALLGVGACVSSRPSSSSSSSARPVDALTVGGATTPKGAVEGFLAAVKSQDLQGMSQYWGTEQGLARDQMSRDQLEKRLVVMQCSMAHDAWQYVNDGNRLVNSREQDLRVELRQKNLKAQTSVTLVKGPSDRWFVKNVDLAPLNQFCR